MVHDYSTRNKEMTNQDVFSKSEGSILIIIRLKRGNIKFKRQLKIKIVIMKEFIASVIILRPELWPLRQVKIILTTMGEGLET